MYLISTEQALIHVWQFQNRTLPKDEWTHEMHLIVGLYMFITYKENALQNMRESIKQYNNAGGTVNSDISGYHETMTVFWLWQIKQFCKSIKKYSFDEVTIDELLFNEKYADRNGFLEYYSKENMMSTKARRQFVMPDLKDMIGVDYFLEKEPISSND